MFRRIEGGLDPDPVYPADLEQLGFFVDDTDAACLRNIQYPELHFDFHHTNNTRHNEVRSEAMRTCMRQLVSERLANLGIHPLYFPELTSTKPQGPHVPILAPKADILKTRKRVVVLIGDSVFSDLGILAYRELQREGGINGGSIINFVKTLITHADNDPDLEEQLCKDKAKVPGDEHIPGLVVMNLAQLLYSHKLNAALTARGWESMPRKSILHEVTAIHEEENRVEGHRTEQQHIKTVFDRVIKNEDYVTPDAEIYVIAIERGASNMIRVFMESFEGYGDRISAMAMINNFEIGKEQLIDPTVKTFLHQRSREWKISDDPSKDPYKLIDLPDDYTSHRASIHQEDSQALCPTFHGGDTSVPECIFTQTSVQNAILDFFDEVAKDPKAYRNPSFEGPGIKAPQPTPQHPQSFFARRDPDAIKLDIDDAGVPSDDMLTPEQNALKEAKEALEVMRHALYCTPSTNATLQDSRERLAKGISQKEEEIREQEKHLLGVGGLGAGDGQAVRAGDGWVPQPEVGGGPPIQFAGVQVDSELVKGAGCVDTVKEELAKLGLGDE
ncbi:hypothetical protein DM02DRAFT_423519 [Periconia macrospinosa]|uniref:Arb2 domain-containing protein n=1 Tax=Periconia macrospinosa TaxID=97972 RepID=A0A2V1E7H0_9PLEO|nr:hypothetical protein DM02DRAFT_423519 [Periconia macrospinosa]